MLTVVDALALIQSRCACMPARRSPLHEALGRPLTEEITAPRDSPPFDKSLVDGYAICTADLDAGRPLVVVQEIPAGSSADRPMRPGEAAPIMTGAPMPAGAVAVVMVERSRREGEHVRLEGPIREGQNCMARGRELRAGEVILRPGAATSRLNPRQVGLLASMGFAQVLVNPAPRVAILPTGDELASAGETPRLGQIHNSNGPMLRALVESMGLAVDDLPVAPDEPGPLGELIRRGLQADVLLLSGGVSAGTRDLVPSALRDAGVVEVFHKLRIKPGKPIWFGVGPARPDGRPGPLVFGLPGNPGGTYVGFRVFVRPALEVLGGRLDGFERSASTRSGRLSGPFAHRGDRPTYHPCTYDLATSDSVIPLPWAGSADLRTLALADGFALFPAGDRDYQVGDAVEVLPIE